MGAAVSLNYFFYKHCKFSKNVKEMVAVKSSGTRTGKTDKKLGKMLMVAGSYNEVKVKIPCLVLFVTLHNCLVSAVTRE